jgi:hypothetical protein
VSFLTVLPLASVMIAGPQIITAILLATGRDARRNSLAFLTGAALAITAGLSRCSTTRPTSPPAPPTAPSSGICSTVSASPTTWIAPSAPWRTG